MTFSVGKADWVKCQDLIREIRVSVGFYRKRQGGVQEFALVRPSGLEPPTPTMSRWCSNQLSYGRTF